MTRSLLTALWALSCAAGGPGETGAPSPCPVPEPPPEDPACFEALAQATGPEELVYDLAWRPVSGDAAPLLLTGSTTLLRLWSLEAEAGSLSLVDSLAEPLRFNSVAWSASGDRALATSGGTLRLYEAGPHGLIEVARTESQPAELQRLSLAAAETHVLTCDVEGALALHALELSAARLETLARLEVHDRCTRVALSPDGCRALSVGHDGRLALTAVDLLAGRLELLDALQAPEETGEAIWHPSGALAYAGTFGVHNALWEVEVEGEGLALRAEHCGSTSGIGALALSHAGDRLLVGDHDDVLRLYAVASGTGALSPLLSDTFDGTGVHSARFSPDDTLVARTASNLDRLTVSRLGDCGAP